MPGTLPVTRPATFRPIWLRSMLSSLPAQQYHVLSSLTDMVRSMPHKAAGREHESHDQRAPIRLAASRRGERPRFRTAYSKGSSFTRFSLKASFPASRGSARQRSPRASLHRSEARYDLPRSACHAGTRPAMPSVHAISMPRERRASALDGNAGAHPPISRECRD